MKKVLGLLPSCKTNLFQPHGLKFLAALSMYLVVVMSINCWANYLKQSLKQGNLSLKQLSVVKDNANGC